jgi:prevent-host-death family protein
MGTNVATWGARRNGVTITDLRRRRSETVRRVRPDRESFEITYRGEVVALLMTVEASSGFDCAKRRVVAWS